MTNLTGEVDSQRQQLHERDLRITESERKLMEAESVIEELRENASQLEEASNEAEHAFRSRIGINDYEFQSYT